ncbi:disease resistance protein RPM1-like protein [Cinnamomum micranthum f. kanehirae]|uniref:Disease resistance protein RPM1-like protein n=1 Tax=Cinnamomum micranthum f. kanehirae TaxID=337451 RepID=A0A443PAU3_9MAGN|nr:disease resistance protein RPM1-like protein [Cinnamomum micranthum f. kanehirae]
MDPVRFVIQKLAEIVEGFANEGLKEAASSLFQGLQIEEIQLELESMGSFLKDADRRKRRKISNDGEGMRTFEGQVREVAYKVEDIIDKYMYHIAEQDTGKGLFESVVFRPKLYSYKRQIASELQAVKSEIQEISKRYKRYDLREKGSTSNANDDDGGGGENWQRLRQHARLIPDVEIVGIEEDKKFLIKRLTESDQVPERVVLSVVGMGGIGKTTLVTKVYNSLEVENHFDCHAWITVSQTYKVDELLRNLMKELCKSTKEPIPNGVGEMDYIEISNMLSSYLQKKRYVIILDDVWEAIVWKDIQLALPENGCGSRVIITTRMDNFASSFGVENVLRLRHLGNDDAFVLFCSKAFSNKSYPPHLRPCAERLVKKCEGLPLAIVTIGGLMSMKEKSCLEWRMVEDSLSWQLGNNKDLGGLKNILLLSFNDLPYNLKYCFLYCSLFPEDCLITQKKLIRLWVAQGFIPERRGITLEEVAADYIKDLEKKEAHQV